MIAEDILNTMMRYCDYQDRCHQEVRHKLLQLKVYGQDLEEVMAELIERDYLNEERYARSFARGRFRIKAWGRIKIRQALQAKNVSPYCINKGLSEIEDEHYINTLREILQKYVTINAKKYSPSILRQKAYEHGMRRGFEASLVHQEIQQVGRS